MIFETSKHLLPDNVERLVLNVPIDAMYLTYTIQLHLIIVTYYKEALNGVNCSCFAVDITSPLMRSSHDVPSRSKYCF